MGKNKKKELVLNRIITGVIIVGVMVMAYPFISQMYYTMKENGEAIIFKKTKNEVSSNEIDEIMKLYKEYNSSLKNNKDIEGKIAADKGINEYKNMVQEHKKIGYVEIPKINQNLPIFAGVSDEMLEKGVGQMQGTSLPIGGRGTHSVLAAHSGLPDIRLFTDLNKMQIGDEFYITNEKETIAYEVDQIKTVLPTNFSNLVIEDGKDYVTLMTCTPYRINTHRLLVRGHRIAYTQSAEKSNEKRSYAIIIKTGAALFTIFAISAIVAKKLKKSCKKIIK